MAMQNMPRSRVANVASFLLRELELHPPAEDWYRLNMFGRPCTDPDDEDCRMMHQHLLLQIHLISMAYGQGSAECPSMM
jgi:hypothetical protein